MRSCRHKYVGFKGMGQLEIVVSLAEELLQLCGDLFHSVLFLVALQRSFSCSNINPVFH